MEKPGPYPAGDFATEEQHLLLLEVVRGFLLTLEKVSLPGDLCRYCFLWYAPTFYKEPGHLLPS